MIGGFVSNKSKKRKGGCCVWWLVPERTNGLVGGVIGHVMRVIFNYSLKLALIFSYSKLALIGHRTRENGSVEMIIGCPVAATASANTWNLRTVVTGTVIHSA